MARTQLHVLVGDCQKNQIKVFHFSSLIFGGSLIQTMKCSREDKVCLITIIVVAFQFIVFVVVLVLKGSLWVARTMDSPLAHEKLVQAILIES